jgi:hypothetical protein
MIIVIKAYNIRRTQAELFICSIFCFLYVNGITTSYYILVTVKRMIVMASREWKELIF